MKNILIPFLFLLFSAGTYAQQTVTVEGKITGFPEGTVFMLLAPSEEMGLVPADSAAISADGTFTLHTSIAATGKLFLFTGDPVTGSTYFKEFYGAPGAIVRIAGDNLAPQSLQVESDIPEQAEVNRFENAIRSVRYERETKFFRMNGINAELQAARGEEEKGKMKRELDSLKKITDRLGRKVDSIRLNVILDNPHTEKALEELHTVSWSMKSSSEGDPLRHRAELAYRLLTPEQQESPAGREIAGMLFLAQAKEGEPMVDAQLAAPDGRPKKLSEFKGKYILLDFWASWCGACIAGFPELKAFAENNLDVTVIGINLDEKTENWLAASQKHAVSWNDLNVGSNAGFVRQYGVSGIPHVVLISPDGIILKNGWRYPKGKLEEEFRKIIRP